jgi:hypothetical protein
MKCPNCGNRNKNTIQDNGAKPRDVDYTLLCVARVEPSDWAFDHVKPTAEDIGTDGKVACGMQWSPNL